MIYLDTSILAAYYCPEPLSLEAERLVRSVPQPSISDLTEVELLSALSRKARLRELTRAEAQRIAARFFAHVDANLYTRLALERRHYTLACDWIARFTTRLRTVDALHLALAASAGLQLVTADRDLARAANALGVGTARVR